MKLRSLLFAGVAATAILVPAGSAFAVDQVVTGTTGTTLALSVPTPAAFVTNFSPGNTATSTLGTVTAVSTNPSWTLTAKDGAASGADGIMDATGGTCTTSEPSLSHALSLSVLPVISNSSITSTTHSLTGSNQTFAAATAVPLAATVFDTNFSQTIDASEILQAGCIYTLTTTYTLG